MERAPVLTIRLAPVVPFRVCWLTLKITHLAAAAADFGGVGGHGGGGGSGTGGYGGASATQNAPIPQVIYRL